MSKILLCNLGTARYLMKFVKLQLKMSNYFSTKKYLSSADYGMCGMVGFPKQKLLCEMLHKFGSEK